MVKYVEQQQPIRYWWRRKKWWGQHQLPSSKLL